MKDYFVLQLKMMNRFFSDAGFHPVAGYLLALTVFVVVSVHLFRRTDWAAYMMLLVCLGLMFSAAGKARNDFLLIAFGEKRKRTIRVIENLLLSSPFAVALLAHGAVAEAATLIILAVVLGLFLMMGFYRPVIPTPFPRHLFEFTTGFRSTAYLLVIAYGLTIVSIVVGNEILGLIALVIVFLVCSSYYLKPEDRHWVWIFSDSPQKFLLRKIMLASRNATILAGPVILGLLLFHWPDGISILAVSVVGLLYLWAIVLAKYAAFPREFGLVQGALLGVGFLIPPLMVLVLAYFYLSASKKLQVILQ